MSSEAVEARVIKRKSILKSSVSAELSNSYDYCMVFKLDGNKQSDYAKFIVQKLKDSKLEVFSYLSVQRDELIVLIRSPPHVMKEFADAIDFRMELNPDKVKELLEAGHIKGDEYTIKPVFINQSSQFTSISPFNYIFGKYECEMDQSLYQDVETESTRSAQFKNKDDPPFTSYIRLKLLDYMIKGAERFGGCDIEISKMLHRKRLAAYYPLHDRNVTTQLCNESIAWNVYPWTMPFDDFRFYFGERITLFFIFYGHYSKYLLIPSAIGFIFQFVVWGQLDFSSPVLPFFCVLIAVWAIYMLEKWKQLEKYTAMRYGMLGFEESEPDRPEFRGELIDSYIDGSPFLFFPPEESNKRRFGSRTIILSFISLVIGVLASIYVLKFSLQNSIGSTASTVASILNTIQITLFNMIYQNMAISLTNAENLRTDTQYEDSMIVKLFVFQFINSYASFFFLAFIAQYLPPSPDAPDDYVGQCGYSNCMEPLSVNLAIIFGTRLVLNNIIQIVQPWYESREKRKKEQTDVPADAYFTPPEEDYILISYDDQIENIKNYADAAIQFGFGTLFVSALPISPFLSLVSNYVKSKVIAWNLTKVYQRPIPSGAEDIGTWLPVFQIMSVISVITNSALVCFTMTVLGDYTPFGRAWLFIGFQWVIFAMQFIAEAAIPDIPEEVEIQQKRGAFITSKIIDRTPDENRTKVRDYQESLNKNTKDDMEDSTAEANNVEAGGFNNFLTSCYASTGGHSYMKKRNYAGCAEIATEYYPRPHQAAGMTANPMNNR